jgi:hypothetical protein
VWRVRDAIERTLPSGLDLVRLDDVWVGAPALAAALRAADYAVGLPDRAAIDAIEAAAKRLMASGSVECARPRSSGTVQVDVRPLIESVRVARDGASLEMRTRFLPDRGAGRPEDVLGILDSWITTPVEWGETIRERLILAP